MPRIAIAKPGALGGNDALRANQLQSFINNQPGVVLVGATIPRFNPGDVALSFSNETVTLWGGASNGTYSTLTLSRELGGFKSFQSGTTDPTATANFPTAGDFGFYNRTSTTEAWLCYNIGGVLWGFAGSTSF